MVVAYWKDDIYCDVWNSPGFKERELEYLAKSIMHLANHFPGEPLGDTEIQIEHQY